MKSCYTAKESIQEAMDAGSGKTEIGMLEHIDNIDLQFSAKSKASTVHLLFMQFNAVSSSPFRVKGFCSWFSCPKKVHSKLLNANFYLFHSFAVYSPINPVRIIFGLPDKSH